MYGRRTGESVTAFFSVPLAHINTKHPGCSETSRGQKPSHVETADKRDLLGDYLTGGSDQSAPLFFLLSFGGGGWWVCSQEHKS